VWFTHQDQHPDRHFFLLAVIGYGLSTIYSVFLWRRGFRKDDRVNYLLLLVAFAFHTLAMINRGFSLNRCPVNNLYEAMTFVAWTIVAVCLGVGLFPRLRFLGAFAAPILFAVGVFALMPPLDPPHAGHPNFTTDWGSIHGSLVLLACGAFGLSSIAGAMFLMQELDLKFHKQRAVFSLLPPIQRLELVMNRLVITGLVFLTAGLAFSPMLVRAKENQGVAYRGDPILFYSIFIWAVYAALVVSRWRFG
jgi:ABC-type uncharacterized transport system permease subunit